MHIEYGSNVLQLVGEGQHIAVASSRDNSNGSAVLTLGSALHHFVGGGAAAVAHRSSSCGILVHGDGCRSGKSLSSVM